MTNRHKTHNVNTERRGELLYLVEPYRIEEKPLDWQTRGLQYTASGYGRRIPSSRVVVLPNGQTRRIYITVFSNIGTAWIVVNGEHVIVP